MEKIKKFYKKAQEETIGFALIIVIVFVILLVFLAFFLRDSKKELVESHEVNSFIHTLLQYTSGCQNLQNSEYFSVKNLIYECQNNKRCSDNSNTCDVLSTTIEDIIEESWKTGQERPIKGYSLNITSANENILNAREGNITANSRGSIESLPRDIDIVFIVYY